MESETPVSGGDFVNAIRPNVKFDKNRIEHLRDLFHSEEVFCAACRTNFNFSKYNTIGVDGMLKTRASKTSEQSHDIEATNRNQEFLLPLEQFILVMPPGTIFGAAGDMQEMYHFSQRIQNWNMCRCDNSSETFNDKWDDVLKNMAIENISPFSVYLRLFLRTTHYFIAMSKVGVHIYSIGEPSVQTVDEVLELEDIIVAKLNGSIEDQMELKHIMTEILFDSATQNIQHPGIEVKRYEEGDFLLVTLTLKMAVECDRGEQRVIQSPKPGETEQPGCLVKQSTVDSRCYLQRDNAGEENVFSEVGNDVNKSSTQTKNVDVRDDLQLSREKESVEQEEEDAILTQKAGKNSLNEADDRTHMSEGALRTPTENEAVPSNVQELECERDCSRKQADKLQAQELNEETRQSCVSKPESAMTRESPKDVGKFDDVELCMTVDIPSDEERDSEGNSNERDVDVSVLCDVEMYSVTSPGHSLWSDNDADELGNLGSEESNEAPSQSGNKATVLSENTNLTDKELACAIQNRFKNIRVYQNKKLSTAKTKESAKNCNKENSGGAGISGKVELEAPLSRVNNSDAASMSCPEEIDCVPRGRSNPDTCQRFIDSVRKKKLKLMQIDPTVNLSNDNVYVLFNKQLIRASLGMDGDLLCTPIYCCGLCSEKFGSYKDLISHTRSHNTNKIINVTVYMPKVSKDKIAHEKCKECGSVCTEDGVCTQGDEFLCEFCGERFHSRRRLWGHQKSRHLPLKPRKPGLCHTCGTKFSTMSALRRHNHYRHATAPRVTCDYCSKTFKTKSQIARHIRIHLGLKPFECIACGMRFGVKMRWREHMYLHTGLKPYNCDICSQDFRHMSALSLHKKMHRLGKI